MSRASPRIERALAAALAQAEGPGGPPRLREAMRHAVLPGGARVRPQLCLAVAAACGDRRPALTDAVAAAIELLHCASLVHDDLPCFDDAVLRRGRPSVHAAYGERLAVLAGDALIVLAFQTVALARTAAPAGIDGEDGPASDLRPALLALLARRTGAPHGIVAGQAWECEPRVALAAYHRAKTASLLAACAEAGALSGGGDPADWLDFSLALGEAYQVADDIRDAVLDTETLGKPQGRDRDLARPSSATELGLAGALAHFDDLVERALAGVPPCAGAAALRALTRAQAERLVPAEPVRRRACAA